MSVKSIPGMNGPRETRPESDAPIGALALHRDMRDQALKVPWRELASACERMASWRSFSLWVRAIVDAERALPEWLVAVIEERCPAFLQSRRTAGGLESLWLDLNEWVDHHFFAEAARDGWIQALRYYYGRQDSSERAWRHWTNMTDEWRTRRPDHYPTFELWHKSIELTSPSELISAVAQYVEWEAFAFWARALIETAHEIPPVVKASLQERCPGFAAHAAALRPRPCSDPQWLWEELLGWIEAHSFSQAVRDQWLDRLRDTARRELRSERVTDYWTSWTTARTSAVPRPLPTFEQWLAAVDAHVDRTG